uniref:Uncharacterized protein n=1 Tax=Alexandrium catenella TaxID=2925 RepID=A0A7S1RH27_ALECA
MAQADTFVESNLVQPLGSRTSYISSAPRPMAMSVGRIFLVVLAACVVNSSCQQPGAGGSKAPEKGSVGKESVLLQAAAEMSKSQSGVGIEGAGAKRKHIDTCGLFAQGAGSTGCAARGGETKGTNRLQMKTKMSKVVLDLSEEDDY